MKASVTSTERLNMRRRPGLALGLDEGFDVRMVAGAVVAIIAPRRWPALMMVRHMASQHP